MEQAQLLEQTEEARQLEAAAAKENRIAAAKQAAMVLQLEVDECNRLRDELARARATPCNPLQPLRRPTPLTASETPVIVQPLTIPYTPLNPLTAG